MGAPARSVIDIRNTINLEMTMDTLNTTDLADWGDRRNAGESIEALIAEHNREASRMTGEELQAIYDALVEQEVDRRMAA